MRLRARSAGLRRLIMGLGTAVVAGMAAGAQPIPPDPAAVRDASDRLAAALEAFDYREAGQAEIRELALAVTAAENAGVNDSNVWDAWTTIASAHGMRRRWVDAYPAAMRAVGYIRDAGSAPDDLWEVTGAIAGEAAVGLGRYDEAARLYAWGAEGVPWLSPEDGAVASMWSHLAVRAAAAAAAHKSLTGEDAGVGDLVDITRATDAACRPVWIAGRLPANSPRDARPSVGAALMEISLGQDGKVAEASVVDAAPRSAYITQSSEKAVSSWKADPDTIAGCEGVKLVTIFQFVREDTGRQTPRGEDPPGPGICHYC